MTTERFRELSMPCCKHQLTWIGERLPNYCPECGEHTYTPTRVTGYSVLLEGKAELYREPRAMPNYAALQLRGLFLLLRSTGMRASPGEAREFNKVMDKIDMALEAENERQI